ncbi:hypothetical protein WK68_07560 [Burkholderia ubonensis]|nr:hypothetical protein WK68_07560 [Burkholderia ubonensis]
MTRYEQYDAIAFTGKLVGVRRHHDKGASQILGRNGISMMIEVPHLQRVDARTLARVGISLLEISVGRMLCNSIDQRPALWAECPIATLQIRFFLYLLLANLPQNRDWFPAIRAWRLEISLLLQTYVFGFVRRQTLDERLKARCSNPRFLLFSNRIWGVVDTDKDIAGLTFVKIDLRATAVSLRNVSGHGA